MTQLKRIGIILVGIAFTVAFIYKFIRFIGFITHPPRFGPVLLDLLIILAFLLFFLGGALYLFSIVKA